MAADKQGRLVSEVGAILLRMSLLDQGNSGIILHDGFWDLKAITDDDLPEFARQLHPAINRAGR